MKGLAVAIALAAQQALAANVFRGCQEPEVQQNFNLDAYLGLWYENRRDKDVAYESGVCTTASYSMNDDGSIRVLNNDYEEDKSEWGGGVGRATIVDPSKNEGYLKVKFVKLQPAGDYKVLETDYENYTVIYTCAGIPHLYNIEYVWILTRDINPSEEVINMALDAIAEKVPEYNMSALQVTPQGEGALKSGKDCPYDTAPQTPAPSAYGFFGRFDRFLQ